MAKFDPELAEILSLVVHEECGGCPHDIGIMLAVEAHKFYTSSGDGVEVYSVTSIES